MVNVECNKRRDRKEVAEKHVQRQVRGRPWSWRAGVRPRAIAATQSAPARWQDVLIGNTSNKCSSDGRVRLGEYAALPTYPKDLAERLLDDETGNSINTAT